MVSKDTAQSIVMQRPQAHEELQSRPSLKRRNAKSGCGTCKIRKVKCDEGRPVCERCISTGRVCDGYGIWGGGGNLYGQRKRTPPSIHRNVAPWLPACASLIADSPEDRQCLEWFMYRAAKKIPGAFVLAFWDTLLFQASMAEPAVLHAVLTLSAIHKRNSLDREGKIGSSSFPDREEEFMLKHYIEAIRRLQPHFEIQQRASMQVALITCIVFICLEFLRGHSRAAQIHLQSGLKLLRVFDTLATANEEGSIMFGHRGDSIDGRIVDAFSRLQLQVELFKQSYEHQYLSLRSPGPEFSPPVFRSLKDAWKGIEGLLNRTLQVTEQARQEQILNTISHISTSKLLEEQQSILAGLAQWLRKYEAFKSELAVQDYSGLACHLLYQYSTMASIMAATCLRRDDEYVFDSYTEQFISLINRSVIMWRIGSSANRPLAGKLVKISHTLVDVGWIPPLYYTALKCRVHWIRIQAIRLLASSSHRELIWDSKVTAAVARKVVEIEEGDFYESMNADDDFPLSSSPSVRDLSLPILPLQSRVKEVKVILPDGPAENVLLFYRRGEPSVDWKDVKVPI